MQKFKPGDRVIRIGGDRPSYDVFTGRSYTVDSYPYSSTKYIKLVGIEDIWAERYFVLDEEAFNGNI